MSLKPGIHQRVAEWDEYLHFPGAACWTIGDVTNARDLFFHLPKVFPHGGSLFFEGPEMGMSAKALYEEYSATYIRKVMCDTIDPQPDFYHVAFSDEFAQRLCRLIESQGMEAAFYHFKGYSQTEIVFTFHTFRNFFKADLLLTSSLPEKAVRDLSDALGCKLELTPFPRDFRKQTVLLDNALNPHWWKRLLRPVRPSNGEKPE